MKDIVVTKIDEVYMHVQCSESIDLELYDFFSFEAKGAKYDPRVRKGHWDGYTRLYSRKTNKLYCGLIDVLWKFAQHHKYSIAIDPNLMEQNDVNRQELEEFINSEFDIHAGGNKITPYDYQFDALEHAIRFNRATLLAATSAGKSLIIYMLARYYELLEDIEDKRILICVPSTGLVEQLYADFEDYSNNSRKDWSAFQHCQKLSGKYTKNLNSKIVISTWQSIYQNGPEYFAQFGAIINDETHNAQAASLRGILGNMPHVKYRVGLTGTLDECQANKLQIAGMLGPVKRIVKTHELQEAGRATDVKINMIMLKHPEAARQNLAIEKESVRQAMRYEAEVQALINSEERNAFIQKLVGSLSGNTLILFDRVDTHGKLLYEQMLSQHRNTFFIAGEVDSTRREEIRGMCEHMQDARIYASMGTMSTGVSIKNLHNLIFITSTKSKIRVLQSVGRLLRLHASKELANVFDITDDLSWNGKENNVLKHAMKRAQFYITEKWKIVFNKVKL